MTLYERIRNLRIKLGMTQEDLAHAMGYKDRSMITKIESGKVDISQKKVEAFANVLNTTPAYLMGWKEQYDDKSSHHYVHVIDGNGERIEDYINDDSPKTPEARAVSFGMDNLPKEQREMILNMVKAMFPNTFTKGTKDDET